MKKVTSPFSFFLMGFMIMGVILIVSRCSKYNEPPEDDTTFNMDVDLTSINKAGSEIEMALLSADQAEIDKWVMEESLELYKDKETPYTTSELSDIGTAFKSRELTTATENYAEFTYTIADKKCTVTIALEKEGVWKMVRY